MIPRSVPQASVAAAYSTQSLGRAPKISATRDTCRINHREFIGNVTGSTLFQVRQTLAINPGLQTTFPWLSIMAQAWEEYHFHSLKLHYLTRTGSTTVGSVILAADYDAADGAPQTEQVMSNYGGAVENAPWKDVTLVLRPPTMSGPLKRHFIRYSAIAQNLDIKTYDVANVFIATVDSVGGDVAWGKLWLEYDVSFYVPQLPAVGAAQGLGGFVTGGGTVTAANVLGTIPVLKPNTIGFTVDGNSTLNFPQIGNFLINSDIVGTGITAETLTAFDGNCEVTPINQRIGATDTLSSWECNVKQLPATVRLAATATTVTASNLVASLFPKGFVYP